MKRIILALASLFLAASLRAGISVTLSPSVQNSARGVEIVFSGTITNTSLTDRAFLNDISFTVSGASATNLAPRLNHFFANVPGILEAGESYSDGEIFRVQLDGAAPAGDYGGFITIIGGSDIFAAANLASSTFSILSPDVTVVATTADASEQGPVSGMFTITRSGGTDIALPVPFSIGGSAVNGSDYQTVVSSVTIPGGSSSTTVTITPIPNNVADGDRMATLSLAASSSHNNGTPSSGSVTIHDKPADNWRLQTFGAEANSPQAADLADYDGDGLPNLIEYALALNPKLNDVSALPQPVMSGSYLTYSFVPNAAASDVIFSVEASTDLIHWSSSDVEDITPVNPSPPGQRTFRYKYPADSAAHAFLRLRVTR